MNGNENRAALRDAQEALDGRPPPWRISGGRLLSAALGALFIYSFYAQLRSGVIRSKWGSPIATRADMPIVFWIVVTFTLLAAAFFTLCFFRRKP